MAVKEGFPPGYEIRSSRKEVQDRRNEKRSKALNDLHNSTHRGSITGDSINYDSDGIPNIQEAEMLRRGPSIDEEVEAAIGGPPKREATAQAQAQATSAQATSAQATSAQATAAQAPLPVEFAQDLEAANLAAEQAAKEAILQAKISQAAAPPAGKQYQHPVVQRLLQKFGLKKSQRHYLDIFIHDSDEKISYTMAIVPEEIQTWALGESRNKVILDGEQAAVIYFQLLFVSCSILAIDGEPTWKLFEVEPLPHEAEDLANDPLEMSVRIRKAAASRLAHMFWAEMEPIGDKLIQFYESKIASRKVLSSLDRENEDRERFVCPLDGCDVFEFMKVEVDPETGVDRGYYCKYHGVDLIKTVDLERDRDVPLG